MQVDREKRKQSEAELQHELEMRLRFETQLVDISARFINLPSDRIDSEIEDAQRRICQCLNLEFSALWQWSYESPKFLTLTHLYSSSEGFPRPDRIDAEEAFPWSFNKMLQGETLVIVAEDMPPEAARDQESWRFYGIKSSVVIPLSAGGGPLIGVLSFDSLRDAHPWPVELVNRLKLVAQVFGNALVRKESDMLVRKSEERLALAADSAGIGLWELDCNTNMFWATEKALEIFGYAHGEAVSMEHFEQSVFPDDLAFVRHAITRSLETQEPLSVEYRILTDNGRLKWIHSSGRPYYNAIGGPDRLSGISIDISARKDFEEKILVSEERVRAAMDVADIGFYEMSENHQVSFLDERIRMILGISPDKEEEGRAFWLAHIHPEDLPSVLDQSRQVIEGQTNRIETEYRYLHPQKGQVWLRHLSRVLKRDEAGKAIRIVGVMQDITERKGMEGAIREREEALSYNQRDLQRLAGRLISLQEEELRRLSRELHDDLTQRLAVLAIQAGKLELELRKTGVYSPENAAERLSEFKGQLISVSKDVHRISRQLHPTIIEDLGLVRAIESEVANLTFTENLEIDFTHEGTIDNAPLEIALCLYRIVQEGVKNIISHANARKCEIHLQAEDDLLSLVIRDDGRGFDQTIVRNKQGLGLSSMRERVRLVGGNISIDARPMLGTVIRVSVPWDRE